MRLIIFTLLFLTHIFMGAQSDTNIEASLNLGLASFQTDYGERGDLKSGVTGNVGFAIGASVYINFFSFDPMRSVSPSWGQRHLKLKAEVSYLTARLDHFGERIEEGQQYVNVFKNMHGTSKVINFGAILEYHPFVIPDFVPGTRRKMSPYFGGGIMAGYSMPTLESDLGNWESNPSVLVPAYLGDAIDVDPLLTMSLVASMGVRYKLDDDSAIMLDFRWQYFTSDYIDALNPIKEMVDNKNNDWLSYLNIGYVYRFGNSNKSTTW